MEEQFVNSIVGHQSFFKGDIELEGLLRIDGDFVGSIKTNGKVLLGSQGRADCTIDARIVVLGGIFRGTVYASDKVVLLASAVVIGTIFAPRLVAESGVILEGALMISGNRAEESGSDGEADARFFKRKQLTRRKTGSRSKEIGADQISRE